MLWHRGQNTTKEKKKKKKRNTSVNKVILLANIKSSYYLSKLTEQKNIPKSIVSWTIDSSATYHMTNNSDTLIDKRKCNEIIQLADCDIVAATYIGTYIGYINNNEIKECIVYTRI